MPPPRSSPLHSAKDQAVMAPPSPATSGPSSIPALDVELSSPTRLTSHHQSDLVSATSPPPPPHRIEQLSAPDYPHSLPHVKCGGRVVRRTEVLDPQQPRGRRRARSPARETTAHETPGDPPDHAPPPSPDASSPPSFGPSPVGGHSRPSTWSNASTISCRFSETVSSALRSAGTECSAIARPSSSTA